MQFVVEASRMCIHIDVDTCAINFPTSNVFIARPRCPWLWVACRRCGRLGGVFTSHTQNPSLKIQKKLKIDNVGWRTWQNSRFFLASRLYDFWVWYLVRLVVCLEGIRCCNKLPDALIPGNRSCVIFARSTWAWNLHWKNSLLVWVYRSPVGTDSSNI